MSFEMKTVTA